MQGHYVCYRRPTEVRSRDYLESRAPGHAGNQCVVISPIPTIPRGNAIKWKKKTVETAISVDGLIGPGLSSTSAQTQRPRDCPFWVAFLCMLPGKAAGRQRVNKDGSAVSIFQGSIRG